MDDDVINRWLHFFSQGESSTVDFLSFMERASLLIYGDRHEQMSALFSVYDIDHNGQISTRELSHMLSCMNPNADKADTERNIMDLMRKADENHDGGLTKAEFLKLSLQGDWPRLFLPSNSEFLRAFLLKFGMCVQE
jgi:Ca2+-binding EF-hand superfamily protein